jgi:hypothetical protein
MYGKEGYSASKVSRIYITCTSYGDGDYVVREFNWRDGTTHLIAWDAYDGEFYAEFNHSDFVVTKDSQMVGVACNGAYVFDGTYEMVIICDE